MDWQGNPRLMIGKMHELENAFEIPVNTKDGSLVYKLLVDKETAAVQAVFD